MACHWTCDSCGERTQDPWHLVLPRLYEKGVEVDSDGYDLCVSCTAGLREVLRFGDLAMALKTWFEAVEASKR